MKQLTILSMLLLLMACQEKKFDRLEREAREYTVRNCPKVIDQITTLDSIAFHNDGSLDYIYYYNVTLTDELREGFESVREGVREQTLKGLRNSIELKMVKEAGLNIVYVYRDAETGKEIMRNSFTQEDYQ
jgi:hypothetical protein